MPRRVLSKQPLQLCSSLSTRKPHGLSVHCISPSNHPTYTCGRFYSPRRRHCTCIPLPLPRPSSTCNAGGHPRSLNNHLVINQSVQAYYVLVWTRTLDGRLIHGGRTPMNGLFPCLPTDFFSLFYRPFFGSLVFRIPWAQGYTIRQRSNFCFLMTMTPSKNWTLRTVWGHGPRQSMKRGCLQPRRRVPGVPRGNFGMQAASHLSSRAGPAGERKQIRTVLMANMQ